MEIKNKKLFAKGKRSNIYVGILGKKKIAIKEQRKDTEAIDVAKKEAKWLEIVNTKGIGPKLVSYETGKVVYEFIEGEPLPKWIPKANKTKIMKVLQKVLDQCYELDSLGVSKEEMHNPYKHILVGKKVTLIDFERARKRQKPQNVTQFCQYLVSGSFSPLLKKKGIEFDRKKVIEYTKNYKKLNIHFTIKELL